ncbi:MAG: carbon storage regulator [Tepidisphaerales bacterium]
MLFLNRQIDRVMMIGRDVLVRATDVDAAGARVVAEGRIIGGPDDGERFHTVHELKKGQSFVVGPNVTVTLLEVYPDLEEVRFGVHCPKHLPVMRQEIYEKLKREREMDNGE